jgi:hypothetical protein
MIEETQDVNTLLPEEEPIRLDHSYQSTQSNQVSADQPHLACR